MSAALHRGQDLEPEGDAGAPPHADAAAPGGADRLLGGAPGDLGSAHSPRSAAEGTLDAAGDIFTAVVTGASRGLGRTLSTFLAHRGARLVLTARDADDLRRAAAELPASARVRTVVGDVADPVHRDEVAVAVGERLDLLVHNASALGPSPMPTLARAGLQDLRDVLEVNAIAPLALTQALLPALRAASGTVVWVSSDAARGGYEGWGLYGASKAALELLAATLAREEADVTSLTVDPGDMRTDMHQRAFPGEDIGDRPLPEVTLPFWAWLLGQRGPDVSGRRFEAQSDAWTLEPSEA